MFSLASESESEYLSEAQNDTSDENHNKAIGSKLYMPHVIQSPVINSNQIFGFLMETIKTWLDYLLLVALKMSDIFLK